jgi:hypothetical protein
MSSYLQEIKLLRRMIDRWGMTLVGEHPLGLRRAFNVGKIK